MNDKPVQITKVRVEHLNARPSDGSQIGTQPEGEENVAASLSIKELLFCAPARTELLVLPRDEARRRGVAPVQ